MGRHLELYGSSATKANQPHPLFLQGVWLAKLAEGMAERTSYPYGYKPIQSKNASAALPEWERQRAQIRRNNLKNQKTYKVLLIGESGVGKSTLVARLCEDRFLAESRQHTLGKCIRECHEALSISE